MSNSRSLVQTVSSAEHLFQTKQLTYNKEMNQRPNQSPHLNITKCFLSISIYIFLCPFLCIPGFSSISLYFYLSLFITLHIDLCIKIPTEWNLVYSPGQFVRILELGIILALTGVYFPFNLTACHQIKLPSC